MQWHNFEHFVTDIKHYATILKFKYKTLVWFSAGHSRHGQVGRMRCQISVSRMSAFLKSHIVQLGHAENCLYLSFQPVIIFFPSKLYMKLTADILPRALWNSCQVDRVERVTSILLKTLKFLMALAM